MASTPPTTSTAASTLTSKEPDDAARVLSREQNYPSMKPPDKSPR